MKEPLDKWMSREKCLKLKKRFGAYETFGETGGKTGGENKKSIVRVLKEIANSFNRKISILEIGSGPGHFLWSMKEYASLMAGVDNSPYMIEIAEDAFKSDKNVSFINGSCWEIPLADDLYDLVFQVDVCMHVGGSFDSILEMIRVSKKYVVFTGPSFEKVHLSVMDKQISRISWAVSVPLLNEKLDELISHKKIKRYYYKHRPSTEVYKHRILVIEK